jgi:hypothetical protein
LNGNRADSLIRQGSSSRRRRRRRRRQKLEPSSVMGYDKLEETEEN